MEQDPFTHPIVKETFLTPLALLSEEQKLTRDQIKLQLSAFITSIKVSKHPDVLVHLEYGPLITITVDTKQKTQPRISWRSYIGSLAQAQNTQRVLLFLAKIINRS